MNTLSAQSTLGDFMMRVEENADSPPFEDISDQAKNYITLPNKQRFHYLETVFQKKTFP